MIIAVDFDGTLEKGGKPNTALIEQLKAQQRRGSTVILWTCREGSRLKEALNLLARSGFAPNLVNRNHPAVVKRMGHDSRKVYADLYIDDKGVKAL